MKKIVLLAAAASSLAIAAPALAQSPTEALGPITGYGSLGYAIRKNGDQLESITGRAGLRFGRFVGVEGEGAFGLSDKKSTLRGLPYETVQKRSIAAYAVGYVPLTQRIDVFGRVGMGNTRIQTKYDGSTFKMQRDSFNYGGGAQFFATEHDGIRADYTRESYRNGPGHANVWSVSYVRKF